MLNPSIEVAAIGNELLNGFTVNTNASEIGLALFAAGYRCSRQTVLADDPHLLKQGLAECLQRSDVVITTGGLGPTCDDITRKTAAELFDSSFVFDEAIAEDLKRRYGSLPISLQDQATVPEKAAVIKNPLGTAPGLIFNRDKKSLILMPGVPPEMRAMLKSHVIPYLQKHYPHPHPIATAAAHFFMLSESSVDPAIRQLLERFPDIEFGIYPSQGVLKVIASLNAAKGKNAQSRVETAIAELASHFADRHFTSPSGTIEEAVQELFISKGWTLSVAESCTGGAIAAALTKVPGSSDYFLGGVVSYANALKESFLGVPKETLAAKGAVSGESAAAMASGILKAANSTFAIAVTGIAGPSGGTPEKPVGTVWIAIAKQGEKPHCRLFHARGNREMNIERSVNAALAELLTYCRK